MKLKYNAKVNPTAYPKGKIMNENKETETPQNERTCSRFGVERFVGCATSDNKPCDLDLFCDPFDETEMCNKPFSRGEYTYATNGHIIVRICKVEGFDKDPELDLSFMDFAPSHDGKWHALPEYKEPSTVRCGDCKGSGFSTECPDCEGEGEVCFEVGCHEYEATCKECCGQGFVSGGYSPCHNCNGTGTAYTEGCNPTVNIYGVKLNLRSINKMETLPNLRLFLPLKNHMVCFMFDGGVGVIMESL